MGGCLSVNISYHPVVLEAHQMKNSSIIDIFSCDTPDNTIIDMIMADSICYNVILKFIIIKF